MFKTVYLTLSTVVTVVFVSFVNVMFVFKWEQKTKTEIPQICWAWISADVEDIFEYCKSNNTCISRY